MGAEWCWLAVAAVLAAAGCSGRGAAPLAGGSRSAVALSDPVAGVVLLGPEWPEGLG